MDAETSRQIDALMGNVLGMRDVVAQLLAFEAARSADPAAFLKVISENTEARIHSTSQRHPMTRGLVEMEEAVRETVDWLVKAAGMMIEARSRR